MTLGAFLGQAWKLAQHKRLLLILIVFSVFATAAATLSVGLGLRGFIDRGLSRDGVLLDRVTLELLVVAIFLASASFLRTLLVARMGEAITVGLRERVFAMMLTRQPAFFANEAPGEDVQTKLVGDVEIIRQTLAVSLPVALRNFLILSGAVIFLLVTNAQLTLLVAVAALLYVPLILVFARRVRASSRAAQSCIGELGAMAGEVAREIELVQGFAWEEPAKSRFRAVLDRSLAAERRYGYARAILAGAAIMLVFTAIILLLWVAGRATISGDLSRGDLLAFVFFGGLAAGSVGGLVEIGGETLRAAAAMDRLRNALEPETHASGLLPAAILPAGGVARRRAAADLHFADVTFHYGGRDEPAIDSVSFSLGAGERLAVIGPSGGGKTTLLHLILRFFDPDAGQIRLDGVDLCELDRGGLRARIAIVAQDPAVLDMSIFDNIRMGAWDAGEEAVRHAAQCAALLDEIDSLPQGFATRLGERGKSLSGGQRQRIAIARAILRDPDLLLLDEATSSLDTENEQLLTDAIAQISHGRTVVFVTHRLERAAEADRIAILEQGRLAGFGTHEALRAQSEPYRRVRALLAASSTWSV